MRMDTLTIANRLVELCGAGKNFDAMNELYADGIVSVEAMAMPGGTREFAGKAAVIGKSEAWASMHEIHGAKVEGPVVAGAHFCVSFWFDITNKASGQRMQMAELAVYQVAGGKIVREEFFYGA